LLITSVIAALHPPPQASLWRLEDLPVPLATSVAVDPETGEWIWTGRIDRDGYGRIGGKGAHREVYKLLVGPIGPTRSL
jgi:hypothetical protein